MRETRLFAYGCLPHANLSLVEEQLLLAHRYRNKLVELELERRERFRAITNDDPQIRELAAEVEVYVERLAALANLDAGSKKQQRGEAARIRAELRAKRKQYKDLREAVISAPAVRDRLVELRDDINAKWRAARADSGLYWGSYLIVERAIDRARMTKMDPRFRAWVGRGCIGVRVTNSPGLTFDEIVAGESGALKIEPVEPEAWRTRASRRRVRPLMQFRVGTAADRSPIWAEFVLCMHRPLPAGATVKWARVLREREGPDIRYTLLLTVSMPKVAVVRPRGRSKRVAAFHGTWRQMPSGELRVGYLVDDRGAAEDLRLPASMVSAFAHADQLRAIRDGNRDQLRSAVSELYSEQKAFPESIRESLVTLHETKKYDDFARAVQTLVNDPSVRDKALLVRCEMWRRQERHLWQWEAHERAKTRRRRFDMYRSWAATWRAKYGVLRLEQYDLRAISRSESAGGALFAAAQRNRRIVALHELRTAVAMALPIEYVTPNLLAQTCHVCGVVGTYDVRRTLMHTCLACGAEWDAHVNAARNMLRWAPLKGGTDPLAEATSPA